MTTTASTTTPARAPGTVPALVGRRRGRPRREPNTVEIWRPEPRFIGFAEHRTRRIRAAWGSFGSYSLSQLCASCYLQGVEDAYSAEKTLEANAGNQGQLPRKGTNE